MVSFVQLRDESHIKNLISRLWHQSDSIKDLKIICGQDDKNFVFCHKAVLAMTSRHLSCLLSEASSSDFPQVLLLPDYSLDTVQAFLTSCYMVSTSDQKPEHQDQLLRDLGVTSSNRMVMDKLDKLNGLSIIRGEPPQKTSTRKRPTALVSTHNVQPLLHLEAEGKISVRQLDKEAIISSSDSFDDEDEDYSSLDEGKFGLNANITSDTQMDTNLKAIQGKGGQVKVRCVDCWKVDVTSKQDYKDVLRQVQEALPLSNASSYLCRVCQSKGLPTEQDLEVRREALRQKRLLSKKSNERSRRERNRRAESLRWNNWTRLQSSTLLCQFCGKQFSVMQGQAYWEHMNGHQNVQSYKCHHEGCKFGTNTKSEYSGHVKKEHGGKSGGDGEMYQCDKCPLVSTSRRNLSYHIRRHHDETSQVNSYECDLCFYRTCSMKALGLHKTKRHKANELRYDCPKCDAKLGNRKSIYEHMRKIHAVDRKCRYCQFRHVDYLTMRQHVREQHRTMVPFTCQLCLYAASSKKYLNKHMKLMHSGDREETNEVKNAQRREKWKRTHNNEYLPPMPASQYID